MRLRVWLVLATSMILAGCDIDFVAVRQVQYGNVMFRSEQSNTVEATLEVSLPSTGAPPIVLLGDSQLQGQVEGGRWWYRAEPVVDTLQPILELEIHTNDIVVAPLPFVTRNGPAIRRQTGDLELPVVYGGDASDPQLTWRIVLVDASTQPLITVQSHAAQLPTPVVLNKELVPAAAVAAEITASGHIQLPGAVYSLDVASESVVLIPIEGQT